MHQGVLNLYFTFDSLYAAGVEHVWKCLSCNDGPFLEIFMVNSPVRDL